MIGEYSPNNVKAHVRSCVAKVGVVVDCRTTDIPVFVLFRVCNITRRAGREGRAGARKKGSKV